MSQNNRSCLMIRKNGIVPIRQILHDKKNCTFTNNAGIIYKLVMVFAFPGFLEYFLHVAVPGLRTSACNKGSVTRQFTGSFDSLYRDTTPVLIYKVSVR